MSTGRTIWIFARDRNGKPLLGADIAFYVNGQLAGNVPNAEGRGTIALESRDLDVTVAVSYEGVVETRKLGTEGDQFVFSLDVDSEKGVHSMQIVAVVIGMVLFLLGLAVAVLSPCLNSAQAYAVITTMALGGGLVMYGFLGRFALNFATRGGLSAAGAGAVFLIIFLVKPTVLPAISCPAMYEVPLRVVKFPGGKERVPNAVVQVIGKKTTQRTMNSLGEGSYPFDERELGREVELIATGDGFAPSPAKKVVLQKDMDPVVLGISKTGSTTKLK